MTNMTPASPTPACQPAAAAPAGHETDRRRGAADSRTDQARRFRNRGLARRDQERRLRRPAYTVEYAHEIRPTDEVVEDKGVKILVDPKAVLFLLGTEMDYKADKMQAQFIFNNPNQVSRLRLRRVGTTDGREGLGSPTDLILRSAHRASRRMAGGEIGASWFETPLAAPHHEGLTSGLGHMDRDFLIDLFADFGPVTIRRMFSGYGISADGTNFALALRAGLYFRADDQTIPQFEAEGSQPFQYQTRTKTVTVNSYWQLPARLFDNSEELADWARAALAAAQRAALRKRPKARKAAKPKVARRLRARRLQGRKPAAKRRARSARKAPSR